METMPPEVVAKLVTRLDKASSILESFAADIAAISGETELDIRTLSLKMDMLANRLGS